MTAAKSLERLIKKLESHSTLTDSDREAIRSISYTTRSIDHGSYLIREADRPLHCSILLSGFVFRHKVTGQGERQILAIHMPGEFLDLLNIFLDHADHNVQALTRVEAAIIPRAAIHELAHQSPTLTRAMWTDTLIDASIFREWVVNVGRRDSISRIAHLLCEFALRLEAAGLGSGDAYELPMTQEQIADSVGLTPVHVNRVLKELTQRGLISRNKRAVVIPDWEQLRQIGDFSARYLHMDQGYPATVAERAPPAH